VCAPVPLLSQTMPFPSSTTITNEAIYWTTSVSNASGGVYRCPLSGCTSGPTLLESDSSRGLGGIAVDEAADTASFLRYRNASGTIPAIGSRASATTPNSGLVDFWNGFTQVSGNLAANTTSLFASDCTGVFRQDKSASLSAGTQIIPITGTCPIVSSPAVDAVNVYLGNTVPAVTVLAVAPGAPSGATPQVLASQIATGFVTNIISDGTTFYFGTYGTDHGYASTNGAIYKCGVSSGCNPAANPAPLLTNLGANIQVVMDADYLYWTNNGEELWACPIANCTTQTKIKIASSGIVPVLLKPGSDSFLYWVDVSGVFKIAKP